MGAPLREAGLLLVQEAEGYEDGWDEEDERAQDPHDDGSGALVGDGVDVEGVWTLEVVGVDGAVAKGEEGGERGIDDVCYDQIRQHDPAWIARGRRPGADERPPEEDRCGEETDVLELMPVFVLEGEVVAGGDVPEEEGEIHREPCYERSSEKVAEGAEPLHAQEGGEQMDSHVVGKAAEEWDLWVAKEKKRWDEGHQEEVLDHVGAEECVGEAVHG